uniref:Uncharacterized protein n=1 Tax=Arion vulgaris TaxID=1028688 RepID=A0A0B7BV20_9EUPU
MSALKAWILNNGNKTCVHHTISDYALKSYTEGNYPNLRCLASSARMCINMDSKIITFSINGAACHP